ncbi:spore germination protein [Bacillus litorisediminis]|uniref:spore germination protein n=1 Tax=Bacillus litorisediminis TaxID=2922713 RepID=UPI001FABA90B|nr:spore germination protein [Bacillus litorisediminis]
MDGKLQEIKAKIGGNDDFFLIEQQYHHLYIVLIGLKSMIDLPKTTLIIKEYIENGFITNTPIEQHLDSLGENINLDSAKAISSILEGNLIVFVNPCSKFVKVNPISRSLTRSIESPTNENVLQGPLSSFNEDIITNIGLIRKQFVSENLQVTSFSIGDQHKTNLSVVYDKNQAEKSLVQRLMNQIKPNEKKELNNLQDLIKILGLPSWSIVFQFNTTENVQATGKALSKGKLVLLVDRMPFALIVPSTFWDMFTSENDRNYPYIIMVGIRVIRILGVLITLIMPGLYVALVSVNPEVLRIELALSVGQSREGVPYPALVEIIMLLIILELIMEASVRLPKSIGPTITMVGGIILGQAAVEAKLVSNLLIIILAATTIANSTVVGFQNSNSIRLFKYLIVLMASMFGILGILAGIFIICTYLASVKTFGIPFINLSSSKGEMNSG